MKSDSHYQGNAVRRYCLIPKRGVPLKHIIWFSPTRMRHHPEDKASLQNQNPSIVEKRYEGARSAPKTRDYHRENRPTHKDSMLNAVTPQRLFSGMANQPDPPLQAERKILPKRKKNETRKPFPNYLGPAQKAVVVAIAKRKSKVHHHLQFARKTSCPSNYRVDHCWQSKTSRMPPSEPPSRLLLLSF